MITIEQTIFNGIAAFLVTATFVYYDLEGSIRNRQYQSAFSTFEEAAEYVDELDSLIGTKENHTC